MYVHGIESRIWKRIFGRGKSAAKRTYIASCVVPTEEFERRLRSAEEGGDEGEESVGESNNGCQINGILRPTFLDFSDCGTLSFSLLSSLAFLFPIGLPR